MPASLELNLLSKSGSRRVACEVSNLVIAGWTGRDRAALLAHIEELRELGVAPPSTTPLFYRVAAGLLTCDAAIQVVGGDSSGEVEPVLFGCEGRLWVGVGSDHTDRRLEATGVAISKQACAKPIARDFWLFDEVQNHWDQLTLRSYATVDGERTLYQQGPLARIRRPEELIDLSGAPNRLLENGTVMFYGTLAAIGGVRPAGRFEIELEDPVLQRTLRHTYAIETLPVVS